MSDVRNVKGPEFDQVIGESSKPVLIDFWAEWCAPCKTISPLVELLADEYEEQITVVKVNVDEDPDLASRYGIRSIPTLSVIKRGEVVASRSGISSARVLRDFVEDATAA